MNRFVSYVLPLMATALIAVKVSAAPLILVSVEPLALIIREVCSDQCEVVTLVPRGGSEHGWQPGPKDIVKAKDAQAAIAVGLDFDEKWLKILSVAPQKILWIGSLLEPMGWWSDDMTGATQGRPAMVSKKKRADGNHHDHHDHLAKDPHIWTDAGRMAKAAEISAEHLAAFMPTSASVFKSRARLISDRLIKLQISVEGRVNFG